MAKIETSQDLESEIECDESRCNKKNPGFATRKMVKIDCL